MTAVSASGTQSGGLQLRSLTKELGGRAIVDDLDLTVERGELVCLLGPSGCGKTTTLRMIAGFLAPDRGQVLIDGRDVTSLRPEKRPTAMVFQSYALWPHMTVFDNVAYGLKLRKIAKPEIDRRVREMLELVNLGHHVDSRPARISGGEQQRVALARALVQQPSALLLDEPLSNLDAKLRVRVREDIRSLQQQLGITTVVVTHDQDEALSISDRVAVMNGGRIEQYSTPAELYASPASLFVGGFVGAMNTFRGVVAEQGRQLAAQIGGVSVPALLASATGGRTRTLAVRPEDVEVSSDAGARGTVSRVIPRGHFTEVVLTLPGGPADEGDLTVRAYVTNAVADVAPGAAAGVTFRSVLVYKGEELVRR